MQFIKNNIIGLVALVVAILALLVYFTLPASDISKLGGLNGPTNYSTISAAGIQIGAGCDNEFGTCTGTKVSQLEKGTCALLGANTAQGATTTAPYDCAVAGVLPGDTIMAQAATTSANGWIIVGANASSTPGYITFDLFNGSGASRAPSAGGNQVGSSTQYLILR